MKLMNGKLLSNNVVCKLIFKNINFNVDKPALFPTNQGCHECRMKKLVLLKILKNFSRYARDFS